MAKIEKPSSRPGLGYSRRPCPIGFGAEVAKGGSANEMSLGEESIVDRCMGGEETLGRGLALEQLHLPLPPSDRQVRVLRPVVFSQPAGLVEVVKLQLPQGGSV